MPKSPTAYVLTSAGLVATALLAVPGTAFAAWSAGIEGGAVTAQAAELPRGGTPRAGVDDGKSSIAVSWPARTVADDVPVSGYRLRRVHESTGEAFAAGGSCAGEVKATRCTDTDVPDGTWTYQVRAVLGDNWTGPWSDASAAVVVDTAPTTAAVTFPAAREYTTAEFAQGCTGFCGTVHTAAGTSLAEVRVSLQQVHKGYWNGSDFTSASPILLPVTRSGQDWRAGFRAVDFAAGEHDYVLRVVAVDSRGGTDTAYVSFTVKKTGNGDGKRSESLPEPTPSATPSRSETPVRETPEKVVEPSQTPEPEETPGPSAE